MRPPEVFLAEYVPSLELTKEQDKIVIVYGIIDVTNYNQAVAEITDITNMFRGDPHVILDGMSSGGFHVNWDSADKGVKAWIASDATAADEAPNDATVGTIKFIAIGVD